LEGLCTTETRIEMNQSTISLHELLLCTQTVQYTKMANILHSFTAQLSFHYFKASIQLLFFL